MRLDCPVFWDCLAQLPCSGRVNYGRLLRVVWSQVLNISKDGDSTNSLGHLFKCWVTLMVKKCFLIFRRSFRCISLCPCPVNGHYWGVSGSPFFTLPIIYLHPWIRSPWTFSSTGGTVSALSASPHVEDSPVNSSSLWSFAALCPLHPCFSWPQNWTQLSRCISPVLSKEEGSLSLTCWQFLPNAA